ncbi:biopolymer transport protein [Methylophilaceae bacterium 11]|nr:biopolymer transport protein [Methylophilaceae bacterium 11]
MFTTIFAFTTQRFTKIFVAALLTIHAGLSHAEWNADWPVRNKVSINPQALGVSEPAVALMRLHSGNFDFTSVNVDGSDIRLIAADDKTELKFYIEKFDAVNELATIWVQLPTIAAGEKDAHIWVYSGNENATTASNEKALVAASTTGLFHFAENGLLKDSSANNLTATGAITAQKAGLIGESAVFNGAALSIAANPAITYANGFTWSAWIKPASLPQTASLFAQADGATLTIDAQTLQLNIGDAVISGGELKATTWQHVAFTINNGAATLYVNGAEVATGAAPVLTPAAAISIGEAYLGEMDEMQLVNTASKAHIQLAASSQGVDSKIFAVAAGEGGEGEEEGEANYIGILIGSLTLDAKIVIAILAVMFVISAWVMWTKAQLVAKTDKDNKKFLARFQKASGKELLELDKGAHFPNSNLFGLYQAGLREIKKREHDGQLSLSGASMDAIKAAIDADLVRETQRQNAGMVLLTIAISGGPFLGLLGTVVGVMITFAAIAAAGDVNVNAIAPGIAAALLATVAGLGVAIPALFGYNYLASRIKNITIAMQIFVDEFVTRTAELFGKE